MADFILITGDIAMFNPTFGQGIVVVERRTMSGTRPERNGVRL